MARAGAHRGHGATRGAALAAMSALESNREIASAVTRTSTVAECAEGGWRVTNGARRTPRGWWRRFTERLRRLVVWV